MENRRLKEENEILKTKLAEMEKEFIELANMMEQIIHEKAVKGSEIIRT